MSAVDHARWRGRRRWIAADPRVPTGRPGRVRVSTFAPVRRSLSVSPVAGSGANVVVRSAIRDWAAASAGSGE